MRSVLSVIVAIFLAAECMPDLAAILAEGVTIPTSPDGKSNAGIAIGKDGKIKLKKTQHTQTESETKDEQHEQQNYDYKSADGTNSVSSNSTHDHMHSEKKKKDETKTKELELDIFGGGVKSSKHKTTSTDEEVHDKESGSTNFKQTKTGENSGQVEESGSNYSKEEDKHSHKDENEQEETSLNVFGGFSHSKKQKDVKEDHEEHKKESGGNFTYKQGHSKVGNTTTETEEGSGNRYSKTEDMSQHTSSHDSEDVTKDNAGDHEVKTKGHRHHHHHHIPRGIYKHLNQDSRRLGLFHGSAQVVSEESMENHAYPRIRQDFLLGVAHKLHNAEVASASRGDGRPVGSHHNSHEYGSIASRYGDSTGSQYRTLAEKLDHASLSSHYANIKFVKSKYGNLPSFYISSDSKYRVHGTGAHGTGKSQYSTSNNKNDVGNLQLSPAEWEERALLNTVILNDQSNERISSNEGISRRWYRPGSARKPTIDPAVKKAIFSQSISDILKKRNGHNVDTFKDVIYFLNGHGGSGIKRILGPRSKHNKIKNSDSGDKAYSNFDNDISRRSHNNSVRNNARYRKTKDSYSPIKYNGVKVGSVDSYGKLRESYDGAKYNDDKEKYDGSNDTIRDSKEPTTKYNYDKVKLDHSTEKTTILNDTSKFSDDKEAFDGLNRKFGDFPNSTKYSDVQISFGGSNNDFKNSGYTIENNDLNNNSNVDSSTGNLVRDSNANATPKVKYDKISDSDSMDNVVSFVNDNNLESSTSFDKSSPKAIPEADTAYNDSPLISKDDSNNNDTKSASIDMSNIGNTDNYKENHSVNVNSSSYDPEIKRKTGKYSQDTSNTDSVVTKSDSDSTDGTNDVKSITDNIGSGIYDTHADGSDKKAKDDTVIFYDSTSVIGITNESGIGTNPATSADNSDDDLNSSDFTTQKATSEFKSSAIDVTKTSNGSTNTTSNGNSDDYYNGTNTTVAMTVSDSDPAHSYDSNINKTIIFDITNASGNSTKTEPLEILDGISNISDTSTNAILSSDTSNLYDSISDKTVISITKAYDNSTDTGTTDISDGYSSGFEITTLKLDTVNDSFTTKTVIGITKASDDSTDTGTNVISDGNYNDNYTKITNETSNAGDLNKFSFDKIMIDTTKASGNLTDTSTNNISDGSYSDNDTKITNGTSNAGDLNESSFDKIVIDITKASDNSTDTRINNTFDGNSSEIDTKNANETSNAGGVPDLNSEIAVIGIEKRSDNSTDTGTTSIPDDTNDFNTKNANETNGYTTDINTRIANENLDSGNLDVSNPDKTVTDISMVSEKSTGTGITNISDDQTNDINSTIAQELKQVTPQIMTTADFDKGEFYASNSDTAVIGFTSSSGNVTNIDITDTTTTSNSYNSDKTIANAGAESDTSNYDSNSDISVIRMAKAISDPTETPFTNSSDGNSDVSDAQYPSLTTFSLGMGAGGLNSDNGPTEITNASEKTDGTGDLVFGTYSDDVTNITQTTTAMAELSSIADGVNDSYSEANVISTSNEFDGSNNATATAEAYASSNGSEASSQAIAIADANIVDASASSATTVANASSDSTAIDSNIPSNANGSDNPMMDKGSSTDVLNVPISDTSGNGSSGTSDYTNTAVTSDIPTSYGSKGINSEHPTTASRTMGDKSNTEKPLTVVRPKKRKQPSKLLREAADATESRSDENDSSSDEGPILNGVDSANTYDSGSSIEE